MPFKDTYRKQVELLIRVLPLVAKEQSFALKGGTAINLFVRDLPRLSVDIDLTYLPVQSRAESLAAINEAMVRISDQIRTSIPGSQVTQHKTENAVTRLIVRADHVQVKIEVTPVIRGCVYEPEARSVTEPVEDQFGFAEIKVVSFADLYAGKLVAALDRQHPRDLFDVGQLLDNEGVDIQLRRAFIVYLLSHNRPMHEVLRGNPIEITEEFIRSFEGMTEEPVTVEQLVAVRERMIETLVRQMPAGHRKFLVSFERGNPDWSLLGIDGVKDLPAVKFRQLNLDKISAEKRAGLVSELEKILGLKK